MTWRSEIAVVRGILTRAVGRVRWGVALGLALCLISTAIAIAVIVTAFVSLLPTHGFWRTVIQIAVPIAVILTVLCIVAGRDGGPPRQP